jgi:hypothetical protein
MVSLVPATIRCWKGMGFEGKTKRYRGIILSQPLGQMTQKGLPCNKIYILHPPPGK